MLKRLSKTHGQSKAEIIRQAIEHEATAEPTQHAIADRSAWLELVAFVDARQAASGIGIPYHWNREEIYAERESRWLRDEKQD